MTAADDQDVLAAEYVLGTLDPDERAQARALISVDAAFAGSVRAWERRLGDLCVMVEPVEPPEPIWEAIKTGIAGGEPAAPMQLPAVEAAPMEEAAPEVPSAEVIALSRSVGLWRSIALIVCALAVILAAHVMTGLYAPEFLPDGLRPAPVAMAPASPSAAGPAKPAGTDGTDSTSVSPPVTGSAAPAPPVPEAPPAASAPNAEPAPDSKTAN